MPDLPIFQHVNVTVDDLDAATDFFVGLGLEIEGRQFVEGEFLDNVCGIPNSRTEIVMLRAPGGGTGLELCRFVRPDSTPGTPDAMASRIGLRAVCFQIGDLRDTVERLAAEGYDLVGDVGEYEGIWLMAYVRGPEGIVVSLTESIG